MTGADAAAITVDPLIGQLFAGRYLVKRLIARGAMGRVYEAEQQPLGRAVAVKVLDVSALQDSTAGGSRYEERFLREASLLSRLTHPNTVRIYDYGVAGAHSFLVMEYVRGVTLRALVAGQPLDPLRVVRIGRQICGSLVEAHGLGLVHRDLKPGNVLVATTPEGDEVKVVDFGLVKEIDDAANMTGDGAMVGTPMYMAPEQIRGRKLDQRVDIYALGVVLYFAMTARFPFPEGQAAAVMMSHLTATPAPLPDRDGVIPESLEWTLMRCLEKDPEHRFADARELRRALDLCEAVLADGAQVSSASLSLASGRLVTEEAERPAGTTGRLALVLAALVAAVLLGLPLATIAGFAVVRAAALVLAPPLDPPVVVPAPLPEPLPEPLPDPKPEPAPLDVRSSDLKDPW